MTRIHHMARRTVRNQSVAGTLSAAMIALFAASPGWASSSADITALPTDAEMFAVSRAAPRPGEGGMTHELRARIDALLADFEATGSTTNANAIERALTLYDWSNALAIEGKWIHPQIHSLVGVITQPDGLIINERASAGYLTSVDNFIRELSLRERQPDAFGPVDLKVLTPGVVDSHQSFEMTYTVGSVPIEAGGGIVAPNHFRFGEFEYQTDDPTTENYVTIRSSRDDVVLVPDTFPASGQYAASLFQINQPRLFFRLVEGTLNEGDTVTVTFGDTSGGSPGLRTLHYSNSATRYPIWVLTKPQSDGGILHSLPEPAVPLAGGPAAGVRGFGPATIAPGEEIAITVRSEDLFRNRAEGEIPKRYDITLNGEPFGKVRTKGEALATFEASFDEPGVYRFGFSSPDGSITGMSDPILVQPDAAERIFWGETHAHSGWAEGLGLVDEFFTFARDEARLDFITLSEHGLWMDLGEWAQMKTYVDAFHDPGTFVTLQGYEYTIDARFGGHHNVLFRDPETAVLIARQRHPEVQLMHARMKDSIPVEDVVVVPHAHQPGDWTRSDRELERLVEIVSYHGTFEWFGRRYLDRGWEVGFIGSSDDHVGSPGYRPRALGRPGSDNFGGLAAVYASEKTRDAIFDSLRDRRTYATNGARILLQAELNGQPMGTRLPEDALRYTVAGDIHGTDEIASIALVKNGEDAQVLDFAGDVQGGIIEIALHFDSDPRALRQSYRDATFQGGLRFDGLDVSAVKAPVAEALNSQTEFARLTEAGDGAAFSLRSGGRINTIELSVDGTPDEDAAVSIDLSQSDLVLWEDIPANPLRLSLKDLDQGPIVKRLDGDDGFYTLTMRRISRPGLMDRSFELTDPEPSAPGDYYYVRIRQMDGGMAWSSPWWVGAPRNRIDAAD